MLGDLDDPVAHIRHHVKRPVVCDLVLTRGPPYGHLDSVPVIHRVEVEGATQILVGDCGVRVRLDQQVDRPCAISPDPQRA